jgi:hypothetical protein
MNDSEDALLQKRYKGTREQGQCEIGERVTFFRRVAFEWEQGAREAIKGACEAIKSSRTGRLIADGNC